MNVDEEKVEVSLKYQGMEVKFSGTINEVTRLFLEFMNKNIPGYELISRLTLTVDLTSLLKNIEGLVAITSEGLILTVPREKINDREIILLNLVKMSVAYQLSKSDKESVSISDLLKATGGKPSSTAARLSELVDIGWVDRVGRGEYKITTYGLTSFIEVVLPKIKSSI